MEKIRRIVHEHYSKTLSTFIIAGIIAGMFFGPLGILIGASIGCIYVFSSEEQLMNDYFTYISSEQSLVFLQTLANMGYDPQTMTDAEIIRVVGKYLKNH